MTVEDAPSDDLTLDAVESPAHKKQALMARMFRERFGDDFLYVVGVGWHMWDGRRFVCVEQTKEHFHALDVMKEERWADGDDNRDIRDACNAANSDSGVEAIMRMASRLPGVRFTPDQMNFDPYLVNFQNCTYNLRTREWHEHRKSDRMTQIMAASYTGARSDLWEKFLAEILPNAEVRSFLKKACGYSMLGKVFEHYLFILLGEGRNGKGVFYGRMANVFGDYSVLIQSGLLMTGQNHRELHDQLELYGKRWAYRSELSGAGRMAGDNMKRLTGGDRLKGRQLYKEPFEFDPAHTLWLITNNLPTITSDDQAIWDRVRAVEFSERFAPGAPGTDPKLGEKLDDELDGIVTWLIEGWNEYEAEGLAAPARVLEITQKVRDSFDPVKQFLDDCYTQDGDPDKDRELNTAVLSMFNRWRSHKAREEREFYPQMKRTKFYSELARLGLHPFKYGNQTYYSGMRLTPLGMNLLAAFIGEPIIRPQHALGD